MTNRPKKQGIIIEAFAEGNDWNYEAISIVHVYGGISFPLSPDENKMIVAALEEIKPIKNERWHKVWLNRIWDNEYPGDYYEFEKIKLCRALNRKIKLCLTATKKAKYT